jgi:hypothetical protein
MYCFIHEDAFPKIFNSIDAQSIHNYVNKKLNLLNCNANILMT